MREAAEVRGPLTADVVDPVSAARPRDAAEA